MFDREKTPGRNRRTAENCGAMELYKQGRTDDEIAGITGLSPKTIQEWRRKHHLPSHNKRIALHDEHYAAMCRGCYYWRTISMESTDRCCHYLLWTGRSRDKDGDKCLSRTTEKNVSVPWHGPNAKG